MTRKWIVLSLAVLSGGMAFWMGRSDRADLALAQNTGSPAERRTVVIKRSPNRVIEDTKPTFQGVALDEERGEIFLSNNNAAAGQSVEAYSSVFVPTDAVREPLRRIRGPKADLGDVCGLATSPEFKELYMVNGDGNGELAVFDLSANGDIAPLRFTPTSHGAWGIFLEKKFDEHFVTIEHTNRIEVYRRVSQLTDDPVRYIQGPKTGLADPHGIYVDPNKNEIYVINHGHWRYTEPGESFIQHVPSELRGKRVTYVDIIRPLVPSTGKFLPPSITVYSRTASGDVAPVRSIQGSKTGMNLPMGIFLDTTTNQLIVANGGDDRILFFDVNASGDAAPVRVLSGPATELAGPTGVVIDGKRNELWVANWSNHTATAYPRAAEGNVAPLRTIRSAPKGTPAAGFGSASGLSYNPKRKEILVPN